ncbi:MAG TPA: hypothetical protein VGJ03_11235 [Acidimicrobiales bacterium]|jgi:hypothetical protein
MGSGSEAEEAAAALRDVHERQRSVMDAALVPGWYWWLLAAFVVLLGVVADSASGVLVAVIAIVGGLTVAALSAWIIAGRGRARLREDLLGDTAALAIVAFVFALVGLSLAVAFTLRSAGVSHSALAGCAVCGLGLVAGGPTLNSYLRRRVSSRLAGTA